MHFYRKSWFNPFEEQFISPFLSDCPSLMLGIAIYCIQHSQAMLERGVCELPHSFFHSKLPHWYHWRLYRICHHHHKSRPVCFFKQPHFSHVCWLIDSLITYARCISHMSTGTCSIARKICKKDTLFNSYLEKSCTCNQLCFRFLYWHTKIHSTKFSRICF